MPRENIFWNIISLVVMLITAAVPAYVAYDLATKGTAPKKRVELHKMPFINPMNDLAALGKEVSLSLNIRGQSANNFIIGKQWIRNAGDAPILPTDYHEKISINVQNPWKILAVENSGDLPNAIQFKWKKVTDTKFEAEPALLNPGDIVSTNIYLSHTNVGKPPYTGRSSAVNTEWKTRIVNMNDFIDVPYYSLEFNKPGAKNEIYGCQLFLYGWNYVFVIVVACLFFSLYLHLLGVSGSINKINPKSIVVIVISGLLSFAAAESSATYLIPNFFIKVGGVSHLMNAPWLILHMLFILYFYSKIKKQKTATEPIQR